MHQKPIGEMLKACRERAGLSQQQLAMKLNVHRSVVGKVETGVMAHPSYSLVKEWARITESQEMVSMDLSGGKDGWKKLTKLEAVVKQMKSAMDAVQFLRKRRA